MAFLNPFMLFGLAAVAVPIIIHLLNKRKFQRVTWAAMRFLQQAVERNQRRLRIEDLLLLLLRCAIVALLALALARPAIQSSSASGWFGQAQVTAVVALDDSASMSQTTGAGSRFDEAKAAAEQTINALPSGSSVAVLMASDVVKGVIPEPTRDLNLARKMIHEATRSDRGTDMQPAVRRALDILKQSTAMRKEFYLITDGQRLGFRGMDAIHDALDDARRDVHTHLILVGDEETRNLGVSELRLTSGLAPVNRALGFEVQVTNYGTSEATNVRVALKVDEQAPSDEAVIDAIPAGQSKSVAMTARFRTKSYHTVTAFIPTDRVPADDRRTIAVRAISSINVLLVDGHVGTEARDSATFFLRNALLPVPAAQRDSYFVKATTIQPAELPGVQLDQFDAVFIADVADFSDELLSRFESYLRRGGGLIVFPGSNTIPGFYNAQMFDKRQILPAGLGEAHGNPQQQNQFVVLQDKGFKHPISALWNDPASGRPSAAHFFRYFDLKLPTEPQAPAGDAPAARNDHPPTDASGQDLIGPTRIILTLADGRPAVVEHSFGAGRVILFNSTADTKWNTLAVQPGLYVPLIYRTLGSIVQRQDEALNLRVGQALTLQLPANLLGHDVNITRPAAPGNGVAKNDEAKAAIPELRKVEMVNGMPMLRYEETSLAGRYTATVTKDSDGSGSAIQFAAQADPAESQLPTLGVADLKELADVATVIKWPPENGKMDQLIARERVGTELWMSLAIAALILGAAEVFLAQWFSRAK